MCIQLHFAAADNLASVFWTSLEGMYKTWTRARPFKSAASVFAMQPELTSRVQHMSWETGRLAMQLINIDLDGTS